MNSHRLAGCKNFVVSFHLPTKFLPPANLTTYTILTLFRLRAELHLLSPWLDHPQLRHYKSTALPDMQHPTYGISFLFIPPTLICSLRLPVLFCFRFFIFNNFAPTGFNVLDKAEYSASFEPTLNASYRIVQDAPFSHSEHQQPSCSQDIRLYGFGHVIFPFSSSFLADRTNGRAYATVLRPSVVVVVVVCDVMYCG